MKPRFYHIIPALVLLTILAISLVPAFVYAQYDYIAKTKKIIWVRVPLEDVKFKIPGEIDVYLFGLKPAVAKELAGRTDIKLYAAPAGYVNLGLNPAPIMVLEYKGKLTKAEAAEKLGIPKIAISYIKYDEEKGVTTVEVCIKLDKVPEGFKVVRDHSKATGFLINPLCFREIRFALNYIVDRDYIIREIYKGFAIPWYAPYSPADPTYSVVADIVAKYRFRYDPDYAKSIVEKVLKAVGAELKGGVWYFKGKPIKLKLIIRTEDERKEIGHLVASELEKLGFKVERLEMTFGPAITKVYATDPGAFEWHIYTEGWGRGALDRWDPWQLFFAAPWIGVMPGWQEPTYWNYKNETIDALTKPPCLGMVKSKEEWINDIRKATELAILESVRIYIAARMDVYPASAALKGVTLDLGGGLRNTIFNVRNWYIEGRDTLRVGHLWVWTARTVYNNYGGFDDVYSVDPMRTTWDPWIWRHPFNGEPISVRVKFEVETAGPEGKLDVPPDALKWDPEKGWIEVGEGVKATSKVVFDLSTLIGTHWHHGVEITWADVLGEWATIFDLAYNKTKANIESAIARVWKEQLAPIVAIRPLYDEKKLEVYLNYWHFDPAYIADYAVVRSIRNPIELDIVQFYLAFEKQTYALDETRAKAAQIPQLNLVLKNHAKDVKAALEELKDKFSYAAKYFTVPDRGALMTEDEWKARIEAAIKWIDTYGIAWISDGPYKLVYFDKDAQKLILERFEDATYPIDCSKLYFGLPVPVKITELRVPTVAPGGEAVIEVELESKSFPVYVIYMILDPATREIVVKDTLSTTTTTLRIRLSPEVTAKLKEFSNYDLIVLAYSEEVVLPSERTAVLPTSMAVKTIKGISEKIAEIGKGLETVKKRTEEVVKGLAEEITKVRSELTEKFTKELASLREEMSKTVSEVREALGAQVATALKSSTEAMTKALEKMSSTITASVSRLGTTLESTVRALKDAIDAVGKEVVNVGKSVGDLSKKVDSVSTGIDDLSAKISSLDKKIADTASKVDSLASSLSTILAIVIVNLILTLVAIALAFIRKK